MPESDTNNQKGSSPGTFSFTGIPNRRIVDKNFISELVSEPVQDYLISAGAKHGDNMQGTLIAVDVKTASNKIHHLVIKAVLPMSGVIDRDTITNSKFIAALKTYPKEILFYRDVRPILKKALKTSKDFDSDEDPPFTRPLYYAGFLDEKEKGLYDYIALEDLRPDGYRMEDKFKSLNFEQVSGVMKEIALLHAVSYCLLQEEGSELSKLRNDSILRSHEWDKDAIENADNSTLFNGLVKRMLKIVRESGQGREADQLEKYTRTGYNIMMGLWEKTGTSDKYFPCVVHGDLYVNNILFKYFQDGKIVKSVKFIDYQLVRLGTIYEDLHYFFFTSTTAEFRKNYLKSCFQVYFTEFSRIVREALPKTYELPLGFTEDSLMSTFLENLDYGLCYGLVAIPFQIGIQPPPQSPITPLELNYEVNGNLPENAKGNVIDPNDIQPDFQKLMDDMQETLETATRNSPVALKRIKDMIFEMVEFGLIK